MNSYYTKLFSVILIYFLGFIVYSNTPYFSFHFDDQNSIISNPTIRNISDLNTIWGFDPRRFIVYLSFAINYHFNELHEYGYHLFNLMVHLLTAILVWWLTLLTLSTPTMKDPASGGAENKITRHAGLVALLAGLVFVSHPLQTEAVTFIVQRAASMATLFFVASLCFYVKSRTLYDEGKNSGLSSIYYIFSAITAIAAMFCKETAITLPLIILLFEFSFLTGKRGFNWRPTLPFFLILLIIPVTILSTEIALSQRMLHITHSHSQGITSKQYFMTQLRVMVTYIRLLFVPLNQNLDYDYPITKSIFELPALLSLMFLTTILFWAKHLYSKYRIVSFSIFWFFLTLLPVSGLLPVQDVIYEHRLYLPMVGFSMFLVSGLYYLLFRRGINNRVSTTLWVIVLTMIIGCNSVLTYQRNKVWENNITLWDDTIRKSPNKPRPYINRCLANLQQGDITKAMLDCNKAIELFNHGFDLDHEHGALAYFNRAFVFSKEDKYTFAVSDCKKAYALAPNDGSLFGGPCNSIAKLDADLKKFYHIDVGTSPILGNPKAPVTIVEFTDFECPWCEHFHPLMHDVLKEYPDQVRIVLKNFPLSFHPNARPAAKLALAAGLQGKYYDMVDLLMRNGASVQTAKVREYAKTLGINYDRLMNDYKNKDAEWNKIIRDDLLLGSHLNIDATPTFLINGHKTVVRDLESLKQAINAALKERG